jgi:positive regulator of sigma E activity
MGLNMNKLELYFLYKFNDNLKTIVAYILTTLFYTTIVNLIFGGVAAIITWLILTALSILIYFDYRRVVRDSKKPIRV